MLLTMAFAGLEIDGRPVSLWTGIAAGAPAEILAVPGLLLVALIALLGNRPGAYWWVLWSSVPAGILAIVFNAAWQDGLGRVELSTAWLISSMLGVVYGLAALIIALGHPVPMTSPLFRWVELGRYKHLKSICSFGERWDWEVKGPAGPQHVLIAAGTWQEWPAAIVSGVRYLDQPVGYWLEVVMVPRRMPWRFVLGRSTEISNFPDKKDKQAAVRSHGLNAKGRRVPLYVWPPPGEMVSPDSLRALKATLGSGRRFLRGNTLVFTDGAVYLHRYSLFGINENAQDLEQLLQWLSELAAFVDRGDLSSARENEAE